MTSVRQSWPCLPVSSNGCYYDRFVAKKGLDKILSPEKYLFKITGNVGRSAKRSLLRQFCRKFLNDRDSYSNLNSWWNKTENGILSADCSQPPGEKRFNSIISCCCNWRWICIMLIMEMPARQTLTFRPSMKSLTSLNLKCFIDEICHYCIVRCS